MSTRTQPPEPAYLSAFSIRLPTDCVSRMWSREHHQWPGRQSNLQADPAPARLGRPFVQRAAHQIAEIDVLGVNPQPTALRARQLEQVVRQPHQPPRMTDQPAHEPVTERRVGLGRAPIERFGRGLHRRRQRVQLM